MNNSFSRRVVKRLFVYIGAFLCVLMYTLFAPHSTYVTAQVDVANQRAQLEAELEVIEKEIEGQQVLLDGKQRERVSIERDVSILNAQIDKSRLQIKSRNIVIGGIEGDIVVKEQTVTSLNEKLEREKDSLAQLIRKTNEIDDYSLVEVILSKEDISDFFADLDSFDSIQKSLNLSFQEIADTRLYTEAQKESLQEKRGEELELREIQVLQKAEIEDRESEKQDILTVTKGVEASYQRIIKDKQKSAAEIRTTLFSLRGSSAIPFDKAYQYAIDAGEATGIRPALVLGVVAQESNLGENVGQCLLTNEPNKGDGKGANTGRFFSGVMKGTRDVDPFMDVVNRLGINPYSQVVSCPPSYGYGGAMGPAQFIPSTWVLYEKRIGKLAKQVPPNPWDPRTAFFASALLMSDNGADRGTYYSERLAALRYFAGWRNAEKPAYSFYGDGVMRLTEKYQGLIDILEGA